MGYNTDILLLVLGSMIMAAGVVLCFMSSRWAGAVTFAAMCLFRLSGWAMFESGTLLFWGVATAICLGTDVMLPPQVARSRAGVYHIAGGCLAGAFTGMCTNTSAGIIVGAVLGGFFGALAFANTKAGRPMHFPSGKFFNYLAAKGLPAVVVMSMTALVILLLITPVK